MTNGNSARDDFRMRYQCYIDDLKYIKTRQWTVTYYLLLLLAAIIGFFSILDKNCPTAFPIDPLKCVLFLAAFGLGAIGSYFQHDFQKSLQRYRKRLYGEVVPHMSEAFQESAKKYPEGRISYESFFKDIEFPLLFTLILWAGVSAVDLKLYGYNPWLMGGISVLGPGSFS